MDKQFKYYGITFNDDGRNRVIYMARSEAERQKILQIFNGTEDRQAMRLIDVTRSSALAKSKVGFQSMSFWMARQSMSVAS
jgi:hypothetical protein